MSLIIQNLHRIGKAVTDEEWEKYAHIFAEKVLCERIMAFSAEWFRYIPLSVSSQKVKDIIEGLGGVYDPETKTWMIP